MSVEATTRRLLLVEDDAHLRRVLARALGARGYVVAEAQGVTSALLAVADEPALHAAVLDLKLPDGSGLEILAQLRERAPAARVVMLTGWGSIATALAAVRAGAVDFLAKPVAIDELVRVLAGEPEEVRSARANGAAVDAGGPVDGVGEPPVPSLDRVEWEHIQRVLASCDGNVSQAARLLGIHRRSLQRKLAKRPPSR